MPLNTSTDAGYYRNLFNDFVRQRKIRFHIALTPEGPTNRETWMCTVTIGEQMYTARRGTQDEAKEQAMRLALIGIDAIPSTSP
ncbi:hypothetical protein FRB99_005060 [Tulasnella sp. 403]|nr:hypothetical protein FRB99_005060 [Tulasnella sp. 403]